MVRVHLIHRLAAYIISGIISGGVFGLANAILEYWLIHWFYPNSVGFIFSEHIRRYGVTYSLEGMLWGTCGGLLTFALTTIWPNLAGLKNGIVLWIVIAGCICGLLMFWAIWEKSTSVIEPLFMLVTFCAMGAVFGATLTALAQLILRISQKAAGTGTR